MCDCKEAHKNETTFAVIYRWTYAKQNEMRLIIVHANNQEEAIEKVLSDNEYRVPIAVSAGKKLSWVDQIFSFQEISENKRWTIARESMDI